MGKSILISVALLLLLWNIAQAEDKCSLGCKGTAPPAFVNGNKYKYNVEGVVTIYLTSADKQETSVKLNGAVTVTALGNCAHVLKVETLHINGNKYGNVPGIEKPVRFTFQDGVIGADICTEEGDNQRSVNIKRAIISLLQNAHKHNTEVDVFGVCPTDQSSSREGTATLVHRSRDLNRCAHREHGKNDLITAIYNPTAEIKSTHVLQSNLNVESKVKAGVPEKVVATEEYLYRPFSAGQNGARARVVTKLVLTGQEAGTQTGAFKVPKSIIFENPHPTNIGQNNQATLLLALKSTAQALQTDAGQKSASIFASLIKIFRVTSKEDLLNVFTQIKAGGAVKDNKLVQRIFLDALLRAGTGDSIEVSIKLLQDKALSAFEEKLAYLSLGNARHVTNDALVAAAGLLDHPNTPREVYMGVGALAGIYCREHTCHGSSSQSPGVAAVSQKFGTKLASCKTQNKQEEDDVIAILKGIRNIRHIETSLVETLSHCINDNTVKTRVKVAALEAIHADPCTPKLQQVATNIMKNRLLDSEIRIKAYQALLDCPNAKVANDVKTLLDTEPVEQVGRYISSSIRFIRASANPDRQLAKQHLGKISVPNKYSVDDRKHSFYRELSYNVDALGAGAVAEASVIYSQDSFLPRSAALNLTAEIFGHSFNVLEIGGRQGNLDRVVEHYLGPKGVLTTRSPQEIYDFFVEKMSALRNKVDTRYRTKRAVQKEIANFAKQVKAESSTFHDELDLDIYVKLFGTDSIFLSLGDDKGFDAASIVDKIFEKIDAAIEDAKHASSDIRSHVLFLDAELAYPTSIGIPLKLNLVGAATSRVEYSFNADIRQIIKDPYNAKVDVKIIPSVNIEIAATFLADADFVTTGLKVASNLYTSTGNHFIAKILENGKGIDIQLALPVEKQELLTVSNEIVFATTEKGQQESEKALTFDTDTKQYKGCFDQLSQTFGLTFCGEYNLPWASDGPNAGASVERLVAKYPLTGPSKFSIRLEKEDLRGYRFKALFRNSDPSRRSFEVLLDVEGTKANRKNLFTGELVNTPEEKTIKLALQSPIKNLDGQISIYTKSSEYSALVRAHHEKEEYFGRIGFAVSGNSQRSVFKPVIEYQTPGEGGRRSVNVEGEIIKQSQAPAKPGFKYTFNGIKIKLPNDQEEIALDGFVANEPQGLSAEVKAVKGGQSASTSLLIDGGKLKAEFQNSLNPNVNFNVDVKLIREEGHYQNDFVLIYGRDLKSQVYRLTATSNLKHHWNSAKDFNIITRNKLVFPVLQLNAKFDGDFDPKKVDFDLEGKYAGKKVKLDLEARTQIKMPGDYSVKFDAEVNDKGVEVFAKREIVNTDKSNFENTVTLKPGGKYELSGVVNHRVKEKDYNVGVVGHLKIPDKAEEYKVDILATGKPTAYESHAKISIGATVYVDYILKLNKGANTNGNLKLMLKDTVTASGQMKFTESDGKGNSLLLIDFKKLARKIKYEGNFVAKRGSFVKSGDLFLDFEKDPANKIHFETNSITSDGKLDTKNSVTAPNGKYEFNLKTENSGRWFDGKNHFLTEVVANGNKFSVKFDRVITDKDDNLRGNAEVVITAHPASGQESVISYKAKTGNWNLKEYLVDYEGHISIKIPNGKQLENAFIVKNNKNGDKFKFDFKSDVTGNLIPKPASLSASADYSDPEQLDSNDKLRLKGNYGTEYSFDLSETQEVQIFEAADKKYIDHVVLAIKLPFEQAHDIKITSDTSFYAPKNQDTLLEFTIGQGVQINADQYKIDANGKLGKTSGNTKVKILVPHVEPFSLDTNYKASANGAQKSLAAGIKSTYGSGKSADIKFEVDRISENEHRIKIQSDVPHFEQLKKLQLDLHNKFTVGKSTSSALTVDADGKVAKLDMNTDFSKVTPFFDAIYTSPSGKKSRIYGKANILGDNHVKAEGKIENIREFNGAVNVDAMMSADNFNVKLDADAPKINVNKFHLDIANKAVQNGKQVTFHATSSGKNILSGTTSYLSKQEDSKHIIEGSGNVKINDQTKTATFKYIRDIVNDANEQGLEVFFNVVLGERSYVFEQRVTNLEYKISNVFCEEKKQCANVDLVSKINLATPGSFSHNLNVAVDLRKLGFSPEFGLQMSSEASTTKLPQYLLDVHLNQDQNKYHLHVYSQPNRGSFPAGVTFTLPKRVIALESVLSYPDGKMLPFPIKGDIAFHLNKNVPNKKAALRFFIDAKGDEHNQLGDFELGFSHPALAKEIVFKGNGKVSTPGENRFLIETSSSISSPAFAQVRESKASFEISPTDMKLLLRLPSVEVLNVEGKGVFDNEVQSLDFHVIVFSGKPVDTHFVIKKFEKFEFTNGYRDQTDRKLQLIAELSPENKASISADILLNGQQKNLFHGAIFIQDNLIKSDYGASKENIEYFGNAVKTDTQSLGERLKKLAEDNYAKCKDDFEKSREVAQRVLNSYSSDLVQLRDEVINDQTLKELSEFLSSIIRSIAIVLDEIIQHTAQFVKQITEGVEKFYKQLTGLFERNILPELKELFTQFADFAKHSSESLLNIVAHFAALVADFIEKHKPEILELTNTIAEIFKDLTRILISKLKELRQEFAGVIQSTVQQIKDAEVFTMFKETLQNFNVPDQVFMALDEFSVLVKSVLPTEEGRALADAIFKYINKKLHKENVDDSAELRAIYERFNAAFASTFNYINAQLKHYSLPNIWSLTTLPDYTTFTHFYWPALGSASFSPINYLINGDFPSIEQYIKAYRVRDLNPLNEVPAKLIGSVINGQHIFTFDGRHLTFPGTCKYVLAHDAIDSNFTIVIQLNNGEPKVLSLVDKSGAVDIKDDGKILYNGAAHGAPVYTDDLYAWKEPNGVLGAYTKYGALVRCTPGLKVCIFDVSGFYLGKLRGLLGNGNNEQFDDFTLPNGKIAKTEAEFGNSYRLATSCAAATTPDHSSHGHGHGPTPPACEIFYSLTSTLRPAFRIIDVEPFRTACAHAAASSQDPEKEACDLARGYVAIAAATGFPLLVPGVCASKTCDGKPFEENYEVSTPSNKADIILAVETTIANEQVYKDLVVPLMSQIIDDLKAKKVDDIKVYLYGISAKYPWPIKTDTETPKLRGAKLKFLDESRFNPLFTPINTGSPQIDALQERFAELVSRIQVEFGFTNVISAYGALGNGDYRPDSVKATITVVSEKCNVALLPFQAIGSAQSAAAVKPFVNHVIAVTRDLEVGSGKAADIVAFDNKEVVFVGDKKLSKESDKARPTLKWSPDACIDFVLLGDGSVISASNFLKADATQKKTFITTAAKVVSEKLVGFNSKLTCRCERLLPFGPVEPLQSETKHYCLMTEREPSVRRK